MGFSEIVTPTIRELFVNQIIGKIFSGELTVGEKLPSERELAEKMKVSRSIVHLGLEDLARMGFITVVPRKGCYISDFSKTGNFETLNVIMKYNGGKLDDGITTSLVEFRNAAEGGAMIRLAKNYTEDDLAKLRTINDKLKSAYMADPPADYHELADIMRQFHGEICVLSENIIFSLMTNAFEYVGKVIWEECLLFWGAEEIANQNDHIIELISKGEGHEAALYIEYIFDRYIELNKGRDLK